MSTYAILFEGLLSPQRYDGVTLAGGSVQFITPGSSPGDEGNFKIIYVSRTKTTPMSQPVILDANGMAEVYVDGIYDVYVYDADGVPKAEWLGVGFNLDADTVGGYAPSTSATANKIAVRDSNGKLPGDITGASATCTAYTAADVLTKIKTVDGSGSGLDADTVRGKIVNSRGVLAYKSANQSIPNSTDTLVTFDSESYDTDSIHTTPGFFVVPSGVTKVRIGAKYSFLAAANGTRILNVSKNDSFSYAGRIQSYAAGSASLATTDSVWSPVLSVTAGDVFKMVVNQSSGGSLDLAGTITETWMAMEIIE